MLNYYSTDWLLSYSFQGLLNPETGLVPSAAMLPPRSSRYFFFKSSILFIYFFILKKKGSYACNEEAQRKQSFHKISGFLCSSTQVDPIQKTCSCASPVGVAVGSLKKKQQHISIAQRRACPVSESCKPELRPKHQQFIQRSAVLSG